MMLSPTILAKLNIAIDDVSKCTGNPSRGLEFYNA